MDLRDDKRDVRFYCDPALARIYAVGAGHWEERRVVDSPIASVEEWDMWLFESIPEKLLEGTVEISRPEADTLSGYYLPGSDAMEKALHLLDRVPPDDPAYAAARMHRNSMVAYLGLD